MRKLGHPFFSIPNIKRGHLSFDTSHYLSKRIPEDKLLREGDILFVGSSGSIDNVARNTRVPTLSGNYAFASFTFSARANSTEIDPDFLYFAINSDLIDFTRFARRASDGKYNFQLGEFATHSVIPVPPRSEQVKIVAVLSLVEQSIAQQERLAALTVELKRTLLETLFTHGIHHEPIKQTEIGSLPQSWEVVELASAVEQIDYGISAAIPKTAPANGVKIVSTADIRKDGRLLYEQIRRITAPEKTVRRLTLRAGDMLFNWRNSAELIGKSAIFEEQTEPHVFASFVLRLRCGEKRTHNFFLMHLMNHWREKGVFVKLARRAVNQANYNRNEISILRIPLPTYKEQREIAATVLAVDEKLDLHRRKCAELNALLRTLLHLLMTAQIRVNDLDIPELETAIAA